VAAGWRKKSAIPPWGGPARKNSTRLTVFRWEDKTDPAPSEEVGVPRALMTAAPEIQGKPQLDKDGKASLPKTRDPLH